MLNYEFPPIGGGAGNAHFCILKEYAKMPRLRVDVLTSAPKPGFVEQQFAANISVHKVGLHKKDLHYWRKIEVIEWLVKASRAYQKLLRLNNYDLVHAFFAFPSGYLCSKTAGKLPYIISLRGSDVPGFNVRLGLDYKLLSPLFKKIWRNASAIVANSNGLRKLALEFAPDLRIAVIPNGVDTERFQLVEKKTLSKPIKLLTVARLISRKRIDLLIEAIADARQKGFDVQLNIAGEGNLMAALKRFAQERNVADHVNFLGRVPPEKMPQIYHGNDVFIMASHHEGMSNAMLEAMACGLPIITTRCEGVEELAADNAVIVERATPQDIAASIEHLIRDQHTYSSMSAASRRQATLFSWSSVAQQYLRYYRELLEGKNSSLADKNICVE